MEIIKFEQLENRLIKYNGCLVLVDRDVADLYNVTTKEINQAVSNNKQKFPDGYILELTKEEKKNWSRNLTGSTNSSTLQSIQRCLLKKVSICSPQS